MKTLKYIFAAILFITLFFSCEKADHLCDPEVLQEPREDNVRVVKEGNAWFIIINARFPVEHHRVVYVSVFYPGQQAEHFVKVPAGVIHVKSPLNPEYGEPIRWESKGWDTWPFPD